MWAWWWCSDFGDVHGSDTPLVDMSPHVWQCRGMFKILRSRGDAMFWYVIAAIQITFAAVYPFRAPHAGIIIGFALAAGLLAIVEARYSPRATKSRE